jgi:hypothetical protein
LVDPDQPDRRQQQHHRLTNMTATLAKSDLFAGLMTTANAQGLTVRQDGDHVLRGGQEAIKAKWFLGGNKAVYAFSCRLDEGTHTAVFREAVTDSAWGIAPPGFRTESYSQSGTTVKLTGAQKSVGGGGTLKFGSWREACEQAVVQAGWHFEHQASRAP